jgi:hypothetical protein
MGNSQSPVVSNTFLEHSEYLALEAAEWKTSLWLQYVEVTPHGLGSLQEFCNHLTV